MKRNLVAASITGMVLNAFTSVPAWADPDADAAYLNALHKQGVRVIVRSAAAAYCPQYIR